MLKSGTYLNQWFTPHCVLPQKITLKYSRTPTQGFTFVVLLLTINHSLKTLNRKPQDYKLTLLYDNQISSNIRVVISVQIKHGISNTWQGVSKGQYFNSL